MLTQETLKSIVHYNPETGIFTRRKTGKHAGYTSNDGYVIIHIADKQYQAHRLAWLYMYGRLPENPLDHINQIKNDNRICNLREVSLQENAKNCARNRNNTSGFNGVMWVKQSKKWAARITVKGVVISLGEYKDKEKAIRRREFADVLYGYHPNHGKTKLADQSACEAALQGNDWSQSASGRIASGLPGVSYKKKQNQWEAYIFTNKKHTYLGLSFSKFEACCMRKSAENKHGYHKNHGRDLINSVTEGKNET